MTTLRFQMRSTGTYGTMEVFDSVTGNVHFRGPGITAAAELSRLNREASVSVARTAAEKARDKQDRAGVGEMRDRQGKFR